MTEDVVARLLHLIDPVCWARDVLGVDPDPWQAEIIGARGEQRLILASRQSGKSWTTAVRACHEALFHALRVGNAGGELICGSCRAAASMRCSRLIHSDEPKFC